MKHTAVESLLRLTKPMNLYCSKDQRMKIFSALEIAHVVQHTKEEHCMAAQ